MEKVLFLFVICVPLLSLSLWLCFIYFCCQQHNFILTIEKSIGMLMTFNVKATILKILVGFRFGFWICVNWRRGEHVNSVGFLVSRKLSKIYSPMRMKIWRNSSFVLNTHTQKCNSISNEKPIRNSLKLHFHSFACDRLNEFIYNWFIAFAKCC